MRLYQFYATATGSQSIQMVTKGVIVCVDWLIANSLVASIADVRAEISTTGVTQVNVNNPAGIVSFCGLYQQYGTAVGYALTTMAHLHNGLYCPVNNGDLLYLNNTFSGTGYIKALVHVQEGR